MVSRMMIGTFISAMAINWVAFPWCAAYPGEPKAKAPEAINATPMVELKRMARSSVIVPPDGKSLITSQNGSMLYWDLATGEMVRCVNNILFKHAVIARPDGTEWVIFTPHPKIAGGVEFSVVDPTNHQLLRKLEPYPHSVDSVQFADGGKQLVGIEGKQRKPICWEMETGKLKIATGIKNIQGPLDSLLISPRGDLAALLVGGQLSIVDYQSGRECWSPYKGKNVRVKPGGTFAFSPNGSLFAVGRAAQNRIDLFEADTGKLSQEIEWLDFNADKEIPDLDQISGCWQIKFSLDGRTLLVACNDHNLAIVEIASGRIRSRFRAEINTGYLLPISMSSLVLTGANDHDRPLQIWNQLNLRQKQEEKSLAQLQLLVKTIAEIDVATAGEAMGILAANPRKAVEVIAEMLSPVPVANDKMILDYIQKLDNENFEVRENAEARF